MEQQKQLVCRGDEVWRPSGSANCPSTSGPAGPELFAGESRQAQTAVSSAVVCFCPYTICHYSSAWASCFSPQCVVCCAFQLFSMCWFWKWQQWCWQGWALKAAWQPCKPNLVLSVLQGENKQHEKHWSAVYTKRLNKETPSSMSSAGLVGFIDFNGAIPAYTSWEYSPLDYALPCKIPVSGKVSLLICWFCHLAQLSYILFHSLSSENIFCVFYRCVTFPVPNINFMTEYFFWFLLKSLHNFTFALPTKPSGVYYAKLYYVSRSSMG